MSISELIELLILGRGLLQISDITPITVETTFSFQINGGQSQSQVFAMFHYFTQLTTKLSYVQKPKQAPSSANTRKFHCSECTAHSK